MLKLLCTAFLLDVQHKRRKCEDKPANSLAVSLGKALNGIASTFNWLLKLVKTGIVARLNNRKGYFAVSWQINKQTATAVACRDAK